LAASHKYGQIPQLTRLHWTDSVHWNISALLVFKRLPNLKLSVGVRCK